MRRFGLSTTRLDQGRNIASCQTSLQSELISCSLCRFWKPRTRYFIIHCITLVSMKLLPETSPTRIRNMDHSVINPYICMYLYIYIYICIWWRVANTNKYNVQYSSPSHAYLMGRELSDYSVTIVCSFHLSHKLINSISFMVCLADFNDCNHTL